MRPPAAPFSRRKLLLAAGGAALAPGAVAAPACGQPLAGADAWAIAADPAAAGLDPQRLCDATRAFAGSARNLHAMVVERGGQLVAESYRSGRDVISGRMFPRDVAFDARTLHDMRSITKSVVSLLWGIAQERHALPPLQTPVLSLYPHHAALATGGREAITIEHLLRMRSGLAWDESGRYGGLGNDENGLAWRSDAVGYLFDRPLAAPPGSVFNYNGGATAVLGQLLQQRTGQALTELARQHLFAPLGITDWEWIHNLRGQPRAWSGLRLRPRDLARVGRMVLDGGRWQGRPVVPQEWLQASLTAPRGGGGPPYGYQWWLPQVTADGRSWTVWAGQGNGGQRLFMVPELDVVVVFTAGEYNDHTIGRDLRGLLQRVIAAAAPR